jgi:integrase
MTPGPVALPAPRSMLPALAGAWPTPDTPVLANRALRPGYDLGAVLFGDEVWPLNAAHPDAHATTLNIRWDWFPAPLAPAFKTFALAALSHPWAQDPAAFWTRCADHPSVTTIVTWMRDLGVFATWLQDRQITHLADLSAADLDAYRDHVLRLDRSIGRKAGLLNAVRTLWAYRAHLPEACQIRLDPFGGACAAAITGSRAFKNANENKTPRIAAATMDALLGWALRMVEQIGPDIAAACQEYQQLSDRTHPGHAELAGLSPRQRVEWLIRAGRTLPGHPGGAAVNYSHLGKILGIWQQRGWDPALRRTVETSGLPIASGCYLAAITARLGGRPWREHPITTAELPDLRRYLTAAAFVVICYLSGMRPGEVLNLRRGCAGADQATGELLVHGRPGKGHDRNPAAADTPADRPWVVVQPVHSAITLLESVTPGPLLFPASTTRPGVSRALDGNARTAVLLNRDIQEFITWVNSTFTHAAGTEPIPQDPTTRIHSTRFRRTLAYFIVRRPRGLIAAALQYGHVHSKVTLGYSGTADTSWLDDLAIERLEMVLDQAGQDAAGLGDGEHVSGPSAEEYKQRVAHAAHFAGRAVTTARGADRLLAQIGPGIHHGQAMTCVWRPETAACNQARIDQGLPAGDSPDENECRTTCVNLAYTDRDIHQQQQRLADLQRATADPLAPQPRRDRTAAQAARIRTTIDHHQQTRPARPEGP